MYRRARACAQYSQAHVWHRPGMISKRPVVRCLKIKARFPQRGLSVSQLVPVSGLLP